MFQSNNVGRECNECVPKVNANMSWKFGNIPEKYKKVPKLFDESTEKLSVSCYDQASNTNEQIIVNIIGKLKYYASKGYIIGYLDGMELMDELVYPSLLEKLDYICVNLHENPCPLSKYSSSYVEFENHFLKMLKNGKVFLIDNPQLSSFTANCVSLANQNYIKFRIERYT
jgi:hypothetical protein